MSFRLVDEPADRARFRKEALGLLAARVEAGRKRLLERVAAASDEELARGSEDDWGLGQVAAHLLAVERGISGIALRLANGEMAGQTGQPRAAAGSVDRAKVDALAARAQDRLAKLVAEFPDAPNTEATARQPYYGEMNCFAWLLTVPLHYEAHLDALERGTKTAL